MFFIQDGHLSENLSPLDNVQNKLPSVPGYPEDFDPPGLQEINEALGIAW